MVGIQAFPIGFRPIFKGENVSFREGFCVVKKSNKKKTPAGLISIKFKKRVEWFGTNDTMIPKPALLTTPPKTNMTVENPPFEDVFPIIFKIGIF